MQGLDIICIRCEFGSNTVSLIILQRRARCLVDLRVILSSHEWDLRYLTPFLWGHKFNSFCPLSATCFEFGIDGLTKLQSIKGGEVYESSPWIYVCKIRPHIRWVLSFLFHPIDKIIYVTQGLPYIVRRLLLKEKHRNMVEKNKISFSLDGCILITWRQCLSNTLELGCKIRGIICMRAWRIFLREGMYAIV